MKTLLIFYICSIAALVNLTQTAPVDPEDEVELVPTKVKVESGEDYEYDDEGFIPIFVIRRTEGSPFFGSFPFGNGGGDGNGFPFNFFDDSEDRNDDEQNTFFADEIIPEIPLMQTPSFFDQITDSTTKDDDDKTQLCGFICAIMKEFDHKLKEIESNIKSIRHDQEIADINNSTYTEKVLPDGTIVKVNKTVISDTSDDGNSFFYHSTSFHNVENPDENDSEVVEDKVEPTDVEEKEEEEEEDFEEFPNAKDVESEEEIPFLDEALNEVPEDNVERQISKRSDPFAQQQIIFQHPNQLRREDEIQPHWKPLHRDTLVNDLITQNGRRGGLFRIEPESEFIRRNPMTGEVESSSASLRNSNPWAQELI